jgi:hypothetical protein
MRYNNPYLRKSAAAGTPLNPGSATKTDQQKVLPAQQPQQTNAKTLPQNANKTKPVASTQATGTTTGKNTVQPQVTGTTTTNAGKNAVQSQGTTGATGSSSAQLQGTTSSPVQSQGTPGNSTVQQQGTTVKANPPSSEYTNTESWEQLEQKQTADEEASYNRSPEDIKNDLADKGFVVGQQGNVMDPNTKEVLGQVDPSGNLVDDHGNTIDVEKIKSPAETKRQEDASNAAKSGQYDTNIAGWYTDFKFEDPSSWIPRVLAGLLGAIVGGTLTDNPLGAVVGGALGWGAGGGVQKNWTQLFGSDAEKQALAAQQQRSALYQKYSDAIKTFKGLGPKSPHYEQTKQNLREMQRQLHQLKHSEFADKKYA